MSDNIEIAEGDNQHNNHDDQEEEDQREKEEESGEKKEVEEPEVKRPEENLPENLQEKKPEYEMKDLQKGENFIVRNFVIQILSSLYCLILISLGIVFPAAVYMSGGNFQKNGLHLSIYRYYVFGVGTLMYLYILYNIHYYKKWKERNDKKHRDSERKKKPRREVYVINEDVTAIRPDGDVNRDEHVTTQTRHDYVPPIYATSEGINFFLRIGLVAFGLGSMLMIGIRIVEFFEHPAVMECYGVAYLIASFLFFIHIIIQTAFLFKFHQTGINVQKPLFRLGILHNVAANLSTWAAIISIEAVEAYDQYVHSTGTESSNASSSTNATDEYPNAALCHEVPDTLGSISSPFLFPFAIEYCLLAAAILYRMLDNVGAEKYYEALHDHKLKSLDRDRFPDLYSNQPTATQCTRANRGLFLGLMVLIIVSTGICFFLFFKTTSTGIEHVYTMAYIYVTSDLSIKILVILAIIPAYWQVRKLYFTVKHGSLLDHQLLVFALFWTYVLDTFTVVASVGSVNSPDPNIRTGAIMITATCVTNFIQVTLLVGFIFDSLQRRSVTSQQVLRKPGRAYVTFLLLLNLSLWLIITFEMKMVHRFSIFTEFYGHLGWTLVLSVVAPIAIYFRFHCAVCLSEIWVRCYRKAPIEEFTEKEAEKCGKLL